MSLVSAFYRFAVATRGGVDPLKKPVGRHHNQPNKKLPDEAVMALRREYEAATKHGDKSAITKRYASQYGATVESVWRIAAYQTRSNPDRPLHPSLGR
jgi:hypothetical protein